MIKTTLGNHIDTRISKIIDKEIQIRLGKPAREWKRRDYRLDNILKRKEITLQEIKEHMHDLYNECLLDFLREKHRASRFIVIKKCLACILEDKKQMAAIMCNGYLDCKPRLSLLSIHTKLIEDVYNKNPVLKTFFIYPAIELKIMSIADFVIKKQINTHLIEMTKGMRYKTEEERTHRDTNEKSTFFEFDMYGIAKYFGQETGRELKYEEENVRNDFKIGD